LVPQTGKPYVFNESRTRVPYGDSDRSGEIDHRVQISAGLFCSVLVDRTRARVEHVFGHQQNSMGGKIVRTIGIARARFKIGMMNLGYNIRRVVQLERLAAVPA
jgi:hypothetical protein